MNFQGYDVVQVIDLEDSSRRCSPMDLNFPSSGMRPFGGLTADFEPLLCLEECYVYRQSTWILDETLNSGRRDAASCQSPVDGQLWISGGRSSGGEQVYNQDKRNTDK